MKSNILIIFSVLTFLLLIGFSHAEEIGTISVNTDPIGANIYLDGSIQGQSPITIENIIRGNHTLSATKEGYGSAFINIFVESGIISNTLIILNNNEFVNNPQYGVIDVITNPPGASIYIDGLYQGESQKTIGGIAGGTHNLKITLAGYQEFNQLVQIFSEQTTNVIINLIPSGSESQTGAMYVTSDPNGMNIYLNDKYVGSSPLLINNILTGVHNVRVLKSEVGNLQQSVTIIKDQTTNVFFNFSSINDNPENNSTGNNSEGLSDQDGGANPNGKEGSIGSVDEKNSGSGNLEGNPNNINNTNDNNKDELNMTKSLEQRRLSAQRTSKSLLLIILGVFLLIIFITVMFLFSTHKQ